MKSGKFEVDLKEGVLEMKYNVGGEEAPQFVKLSAPAAALILPMLDVVKMKIEAGEIDPVKGVDFDKELALKAIDAIKIALA